MIPQELQVVRSAALGLSNREIVRSCFFSPRTVDYHLYKRTRSWVSVEEPNALSSTL